MEEPRGMLCVIPSRLEVGEPFDIKVKVRGTVRKIETTLRWEMPHPALHGPFNLNVQRQIQYMDDCPAEWKGRLIIDGEGALEGGDELVFDGTDQGTFPEDTRPIRAFGPFRLTRPGFHFLKLTDPASGFEGWSNPVYVSDGPPTERIYWGDPHWQTFFSDGIRCPEELYTFARDEAFLDFGAVSDHMECVTDREWELFQAVTDDFNEPGRFVTLFGQEWTHHDPARGAPGHRNVYFRRRGGPALRSTDPDCDTLTKLWRKLDGLSSFDPIAIPHHPANVVMGVDWSQGWNPKYEKAVEIHSVWGSSERSAEAGNPRPIYHLEGEKAGRHVVDALRMGYRFGFMGGGDIHDGRPGDELHEESYPPRDAPFHPQGFTAAYAPALTRDGVFDAIRDRRTYATTKTRLYLETSMTNTGRTSRVAVRAASEEGIREAALVRNGEDTEVLGPSDDPRVLECGFETETLGPEEFCYIRVTTRNGNMAWNSPFWSEQERSF